MQDAFSVLCHLSCPLLLQVVWNRPSYVSAEDRCPVTSPIIWLKQSVVAVIVCKHILAVELPPLLTFNRWLSAMVRAEIHPATILCLILEVQVEDAAVSQHHRHLHMCVRHHVTMNICQPSHP